MNILIVSPEPWSHIFVSKHHYARTLARRGHNVFFLEPPSINNSFSTYYDSKSGVCIVNYGGFPRGLRWYPRLIQLYFTRQVFNTIERLCRTKIDVIWSFDNSVFFRFDALRPAVVKISHIVDLNQAFEVETAASTAEICLGVCQPIVNRNRMFNDNSFFVHHGFNDQHTDTTAPSIPGNQRVKAVYSGNLAIPFLDWTTLLKAAEVNEDVDFIFIGPGIEDTSSPGNESKVAFRQLPNTHFLGKRDSSELKGFYSLCDMALICYLKTCHDNQAVNPHKMMEYFGSGIVPVATKTQAFQTEADSKLFLMSGENEDFPALVTTAKENLGHWNSAELKQRRVQFALNNSYDRQIDRIGEILTDTLKRVNWRL